MCVRVYRYMDVQKKQKFCHWCWENAEDWFSGWFKITLFDSIEELLIYI